MAETALQRIGPLQHIPAVLESLGIPRASQGGILGSTAEALKNPDTFIPFAEAGALLERCAAASGCAHFGLLVGERADHRDLGLPGLLMASAATIGEALLDFASCQLRNSNGAVVFITRAEENIFVGYGVYDRSVAGSGHIYDLAAAVGINLLKRLGGPRARAAEVMLSRRTPRDRQPYYRILGEATHFDQPQTTIIVPDVVAALAVTTRDDAEHARLLSQVRLLLDRHYPEFRARVQHTIRPNLLMGTVSAREVARQLGVHVRTLNRRLRDENTTFRELSQQVRYSVACELLTSTDLPISDVASALAYATPAAFVHAFQRWSGMAPSEWRGRRIESRQPTAETRSDETV